MAQHGALAAVAHTLKLRFMNGCMGAGQGMIGIALPTRPTVLQHRCCGAAALRGCGVLSEESGEECSSGLTAWVVWVLVIPPATPRQQAAR